MSRLTPGKMATSIRVLSDKKKESARARITLLDKFLNGSREDREMAAHFDSFARLADWHDPELGITRMSPKTLRGHVQALYEGGQEAFLARLRQSQENPKPALEKTLHAGAAESAQRRAGAVLELTSRYLDLLDRFKRLASISADARSELQNHFRIHGDGINPLRRVK